MAVNKVVYGKSVLMDLTKDTVSSDYLVSGRTAHGKDGNSVSGNLFEGIPSSVCLDDTILDSQGNPILNSSNQAIDGRIVYDSGGTNHISGNGHVGWEGIVNRDIPRIRVKGACQQNGVPTPEKPIEPVFVEGTSIGARGKNLFDSNAKPFKSSVYLNSQGLYVHDAESDIYRIDTLGGAYCIRMDKPYYSLSIGAYDCHNNLLAIKNHESLKEYRFEAPAGTAYILESVDRATKESVQIEYGSTPTPYEPYYDGGTVTFPILRSLPDGSIRDEIDITSGIAIRRLGIRVFDGSENWSLYSGWGDETSSIALNFPDSVVGFNTSICSHFLNVERAWGEQHNNDHHVYSDHSGSLTKYFRFPKNISSVDKFKEWLSLQKTNGTPVRIWYTLATPIVEHYDPAILRQHPGYTQLMIRNSELPARIDADVYRAQIIRM